MTTNGSPPPSAAGRDVDAMVAEALGWTRLPTTNWPTWGFPPGVEQIRSCNERMVPAYSRDPAAAQLVIDAMRAKGYMVRFEFYPNGPVVALVIGPSGAVETRCERFSAETMPLAVCRAALSALAPAGQECEEP